MGFPNRWGSVLLAAALIATPAIAQDKDSFTPMPMDKGFGPMDLTPPTTPPDEIVKKFAAKESEFQDALNHYTYRRVARVQTLDDDNKVDGEYYQVDDVIFDSIGKRTEKVVFAPEQHSGAGHDDALRSCRTSSAATPSCSPPRRSASTTSSTWAGKRSTRWIATPST